MMSSSRLYLQVHFNLGDRETKRKTDRDKETEAEREQTNFPGIMFTNVSSPPSNRAESALCFYPIIIISVIVRTFFSAY